MGLERLKTGSTSWWWEKREKSILAIFTHRERKRNRACFSGFFPDCTVYLLGKYMCSNKRRRNIGVFNLYSFPPLFLDSPQFLYCDIAGRIKKSREEGVVFIFESYL
jgi:hypothetical protein